MNTVKIHEIEIYYDDKQKSQIDQILNTIKNNYEIILSSLDGKTKISLTPSTSENVIFVSNFDDFFHQIANRVFNTEENKKIFYSHELLPILYIEHLIRKSEENQTTYLMKPNKNISDEMFYSTIAYFYFMKTSNFEEFIKYLKDKKNKGKIIKWLQTESRFKTYNYLLELLINYLKENDFDFIDNINDIINASLKQFITNIFKYENSKDLTLPKLNNEEFEKLFREFLGYINAPSEWEQTYENLKSNKYIKFQDNTDDIDKSQCYFDEDGRLKILITTDGTIKSFCSFIHEFAHYIAMQDKTKMPNLSISELPSIFFEKLSLQFLKDKGYSEEVIEKITNQRDENNKHVYMSLSILLTDIRKFRKSGPITRTEKISAWEKLVQFQIATKEKLLKTQETNDDINSLQMPNINVLECVDQECDQLIDCILQQGVFVINGYQYLLDTYLSEEILKKCEGDTSVIPKMINITNSLGSKTLKEILEEFDLMSFFSQIEEEKMSKKMIKQDC